MKKTEFDNIIAELKAKDLHSEKEIMDYLQKHASEGLLHQANFSSGYSDRESTALSLVSQALSVSDPDKAKAIIAEALTHYPQSIEAYEQMGYYEELPFFATVWFEKAIRLGEKQFGKMYRRYHKGSYWQYLETHAYLRALNRYAECQWAVGNAKEAIRSYKNLLELDPDDHLTCRWKMVANMIESYDYVGLSEQLRSFQNDNSAFAKYVLWLERFIFGSSKDAKKLFEEATTANALVPRSILAQDEIQFIYDDFKPGSAEEAHYIASFIYEICSREHRIMSELRKYEKAGKSGGSQMRRVK